MATKYLYTGKSTPPNLDKMTADIGLSTMTDKAIIGFRWDKGADGPDGAETLSVHFTNSLSSPDKTAFDTIVTNNS